MVEAVVRLARDLRAAGETVSAAEVRDASAAVAALGVTDREQLRWALRACLAKSESARATFEPLFEAHFTVPWPWDEPGKKKRRRKDRPAEAGAGKSSGRGAAPQPRQPLEQEQGRAEQAELRRESELGRQVAIGRARQRVAQRRADHPARRALDRRLEPAEELAIDRELERLGRVLRTRYGRRRYQASHGRLDLRRTVTAAVRTGGWPIRLARRRQRLARPRLLVLCDVSGSVARVSRFLLRLLHETQRLFDQTHGFVFVDRPILAAPLFRQADFESALETLDELPGLDLHAYSDYGHLFVRLLQDQGELLTSRTSLLILGDGRSNQFDPQTWAFAEIASRVRRVIWLNPERPERWHTGDSQLRAYQPWLDHLIGAGTAEALAAGVEALLVELP